MTIRLGKCDGDGIVLKGERGEKLRLRRRLGSDGFQVYIVESLHSREKIVLGRYLLDRFRATVREIIDSDRAQEVYTPINIKIHFRLEVRFHIRSESSDVGIVVLSEAEALKAGTGILHLHRENLPILDALLHHSDLGHPSDLLARIVAYHRLFRATFAEGSDSITSDLTLRKDILAETIDFVPVLGSKNHVDRPLAEFGEETGQFPSPSAKVDRKKGEGKPFRSKLGLRDERSDYRIDYETLFGVGAGARHTAPIAASKSGTGPFMLPLLAQDVKALRESPLRCELEREEMIDLRDRFIVDRKGEVFLGFEICDAVFRNSTGKLKSFRFPLYYMPVTMSESGRTLLIEPASENRFYINHLALAVLVDKFSPVNSGRDPISHFFTTLLSQSLVFEEKVGRIYLSRILPVAEDIFERTREIFLGFAGEKGKGGLFGDLELVGIECDLESVLIYKAAKVSAPLAQALENDLNLILRNAVDFPSDFQEGLLQRFLMPRGVKPSTRSPRIFDQNWMPESLSKSMRKLVENCNAHDMLLLEGPPGTGKTFAIMNLFIQCVCEGKKLLVVSDQAAGIEALCEKLMGYMLQGSSDAAVVSSVSKLWKSSIGVVGHLPHVDHDLADWATALQGMVSGTGEFATVDSEVQIDEGLARIDSRLQKVRVSLQQILEGKIGSNSSWRNRVSPKRLHATTIGDIKGVVTFLKFLGSGKLESIGGKTDREAVESFLRKFIEDREYLIASSLTSYYDLFRLPGKIKKGHTESLERMVKLVELLIRKQPCSFADFQNLGGDFRDLVITRLLGEKIVEHFPIAEPGILRELRKAGAIFHYPLKVFLTNLRRILRNHQRVLAVKDRIAESVWAQLQTLHQALAPAAKEEVPLALEICRFAVNSAADLDNQGGGKLSVQEHLEEISRLQVARDELVRQKFIMNLTNLAARFNRSEAQQPSRATRLSAILDSLRNETASESTAAVLEDFRREAIEAFPVWICRKQAVSFLFPCHEGLFDLVVVDEATQCRVDDALPLIHRARKLMVVGDDRQTVLARDSALDDYLFQEFNLDEHLRFSRAHGIKGGGSNLFGLMKGVKQASVLLDEHYRCPPDIIQFSNLYVYNGQLKPMQWSPKGGESSAIVDYSEKAKKKKTRAVASRYKGIDTQMVDNFLEYVAAKIPELEREYGRPINMETDVAICYFLLKNEPYIKDRKPEFLAKLGRGSDVLDGAGAALQGKERDFIFYLWDITRGNLPAFKQGDEADRRRGELNVLMSRPRRRAYHFLHREFDQLPRGRAKIIDYLWGIYEAQQASEVKATHLTRESRPGPFFVPWRRYSGQLIQAILQDVMGGRHADRRIDLKAYQIDYSVAVGDPRFRVDLMLIPKDQSRNQSVAIIDLCGFEGFGNLASEVIDYYFQLRRAQPQILPVFLFLHEVARETTGGFKRLEAAIAGEAA